jgi:hypothetical protein
VVWGYAPVPAEFSNEISSRIAAGEQLVVRVLREIRRDAPSGPRATLRLQPLLAGEMKLTIVERNDVGGL